MSTVSVPRVKTEENRGRVASYLRANPGKHRQSELVRALGIAQGSLGKILSDPIFIRHPGGYVEMNPRATRNRLHKPRRYGQDVLLNVRWAVFTELSVKQPQYTTSLVRELKLDRDLIEQALDWPRFRKTCRGWLIVPKGEVLEEAGEQQPAE